MSLANPLLTAPLVPGATRPELPPLAEHIHTRLPKVWVGYGFALVIFMLVLVGEASPNGLDVSALGLLLYFPGWLYWLFCVHRIHRVLKEATNGTYSISPRRAVGFQVIPIFSVIWGFKWTKRIAEFVNGRTDSHRTSRFVPATFLLIAWLLGVSGILAPLHLLIGFGVVHYLTRRIKQVLPPYARETVATRRAEHQFDLAIYAGVGAVFAFKLVQAFAFALDPNHRRELGPEILAIVLVSCGVLLFIEPTAGFWRERLGLEEHHAQLIGRSRGVKIAFFAILSLTSLAHGFLHKLIESEMHDSALRTIMEIAGATLVSGGITYAWVSGACRQKPRAARFGVMTGAVVGLFVASLALSVPGTHKSTLDVNHIEEEFAPGNAQDRVVPLPREIRRKAVENYDDLGRREEWELDLWKIVLPWSIFGLVGGLVIDWRLGKQASRTVAFAIFASAVVFFLADAIVSRRFGLTKFSLQNWEVVANICAVGGWALSLIAFPHADKALAGAHADGKTHLKILGPIT